jgi:predicted nucleic acid-binding protein
VILVDSNVLIDIAANDPIWFQWSVSQLRTAALRDSLFINDVIYAEMSVRFPSISDLDKFMSDAQVSNAPIPREALFLAGKAFLQYRRSGGLRTGVLPDFFIGAHAAAQGVQLLTRDTRRYRTYFPTLELISPNAH